MGINQKNILSQQVGVHRIEQNLYLRVQASGASFVFRYMRDGRRTDIGVGSARKVTIARAKEIAAEFRSQIAKGQVPSKEKKTETHERTFREVALEAVEKTEIIRAWKSPRHKRSWLQILRDFAFPAIGDMRIDKITRNDIIAVLEPIWRTKTPTASTLRVILERVFACAIFSGEYTGANPAVYRGNLDLVLPVPSKIRQVKHFASMTLDELEAALPQWLSRSSSISLAIVIVALTALRSTEVTLAEWTEFDLENRIFSVPVERRKVYRDYPHRVPLSDQAVLILRYIGKINDMTGYVFKSAHRRGAPISKTSPVTFLWQHSGKTVHGLRSTFRVWVEENRLDAVAAEYQMMHENPSAVVRAYQRSDLLEQRRKLMQQWADEILPMNVLKDVLEKLQK